MHVPDRPLDPPEYWEPDDEPNPAALPPVIEELFRGIFPGLQRKPKEEKRDDDNPRFPAPV